MNPSAIEQRTISKMMRNLLPLAVLLYLVNIIDRTNIGFTALEMNKALNIEAAAFGIISAVFFVGYTLVEVPSNIMLHKFGARVWMTRIMITWGLTTCAMFYAQNYTHVLILRVLLGICEAGFFPGMIYYFSYWFPARYQARIVAAFFLAAPVAFIIGAPISTMIMDNVSWLGAAGWRWVFMIEGLMAILGGVICLAFMKDKPQDAKWLEQDEKEWITKELAAEEAKKVETAHFSIGKVFAYGKVWRLAFIYMFIQIPAQTVAFWMPTFVKEFSTAYSNTIVGYLMMMPPTVGFISLMFWGRHSDKTGERVKHSAVPMILFVIALGMIALSSNINVKIAGLIMSGIGTFAFYAPFWAMPTIYLSGEAMAVGVAIINSMSSFGGFAGNMIIGQIKGSDYGTSGVLIFQMLCAAIAFVMCITLESKSAPEKKPQ